MDKNEAIERLFYIVEDPESPIENCPALTTIMYKVCNGDAAKFDEACRLIRLFMEAAFIEGTKVSGS